MMIFLNIGVLALVAWGAWWLTGFDKTAGGESKRTHYFSRLIRCAAILWLTGVFLWFIEQRESGYGGVALLLIIPPSLALLLRSSLAEVLTHAFLRLVDPTLHDDRPPDPGKSRRYLDTVAHLVRNGRRDEAIKLCEQFKQSGEVDRMTLEMMLEFLGVKQEHAHAVPPLTQAARLRAQEKFTEAEQLLKSLLAKRPADTDAAMMLMRLYAEDLQQPGRAREVLRRLEQQPHVPAGHIEFARQSIDEWAAPKQAETIAATATESIDALVASGRFGSAIERLEQKVSGQPADFEAWLKLAEIHGWHCHNLPRAEKIIRQIELNRNFSREQIQIAEARLKTWREPRKAVV